MRTIGTKKIIISLLTGIAMLIIGFFTPQEDRFFLVLISFLCTVVCLFRWMILYDQYDPEADVFGMRFSSRRFPVFIENEGKMNALVFSIYKWVIISLVLLFLLP